jgi:hypothetical protein
MLENILEASCGEIVLVVIGSVVSVGMTVTVTVTMSGPAGVAGKGKLGVVDELEEAEESVPLVEPEASAPVMPPLAPDASIIERALFSLVHVKVYD